MKNFFGTIWEETYQAGNLPDRKFAWQEFSPNLSLEIQQEIFPETFFKNSIENLF